MEKSFIAFIEESIKKNWDLDALTDYKGATLQYKDVARKIEKLHILLEESGVKPGDKVALCGRNSSRLSPVIGRKGQMIKFKGTTIYPPVLFDILDNIPEVSNYIVEVFTNSLGTDQIQIRIGSNNHSDLFVKQIKDIFRARVRVAPDIKFEPVELIARLQTPPMSRKIVKFFDLRQTI